jgi:hypothetical protein
LKKNNIYINTYVWLFNLSNKIYDTKIGVRDKIYTQQPDAYREETAELERVLNSIGIEEEFEGMVNDLPRLSLNGEFHENEDGAHDAEYEVDGRPASRCSHRLGRRRSSVNASPKIMEMDPNDNNQSR